MSDPTPIAAYNTLISARATGTALGLTRISGATDAALTAALVLAAIDIDSAMRYQGSKYDPQGAISGTVQVREFPRWKNGVPVWGDGVNYPVSPYPPISPACDYAAGVWDWDPVTKTAIVPDAVKMAEVIQADSILAADRDARLQAIADGLRSQQIGQQHEMYELGVAPSQLCLRAESIMRKYCLRSGRML